MSKYKVVNSVTVYPSCFVCGCQNTGSYPLYIRKSGQSVPFFPFLESHEPPDGADPPTKGGMVISCYACSFLLTEQWKSYERNKVPLVKRIYWLKRVDNGPYAGVEIGLQTEYASQVLGISTENLDRAPLKKQHSPGLSDLNSVSKCSHTKSLINKVPENCSFENTQKMTKSCNKTGIQEEALDLSIEGPKKKLKLKNNSSEVLDLSMPDKDASTEVCYTCGKQFDKGTLTNVYAKMVDSSQPFFPNLMLHPRPSGSRPMEPSGRVSCCNLCSEYLLSQWMNFERLNIPHDIRNYFFKVACTKENDKRCCFKCNKFKSSMLKLLQLQVNGKNKYFRISSKLVIPNVGSSSLVHKELYVCNECFLTLNLDILNQTENSVDFYEIIRKIENSESNAPNVFPVCSSVSPKRSILSESEASLELVPCYLCHQSYPLKQLQTLSMKPDLVNSTSMFFPFIKFLPHINQDMITEDGRILACKACYNHLSTQWTEYEKECIPTDQRHFSLRTSSVASSYSPRLASTSNSSSPPSPSGNSISSPTYNLPNPQFDDNDLESFTNKSSSLDSKINIKSLNQNPTNVKIASITSEKTRRLPRMTKQKGLNVKINCHICAFPSKSGHTYAVSSIQHGNEMYFPFLQKYVSRSSDSKVDENSYLLCLICFHSLLSQWMKYEKNTTEHSARIYNTYSFSCYVCGTKTYRKRLYLLPVKDYPFLKEHPCPPGGMIVNNGYSVVVCKDCHVSLNDQYTALERLGVPVEKKQYNWIQRPPPPEIFQKSAEREGFENRIVSHKVYKDGRSLEQSLSSQRNCAGGIHPCSRDLNSSSIRGTWRSPTHQEDEMDDIDVDLKPFRKSPLRPKNGESQ